MGAEVHNMFIAGLQWVELETQDCMRVSEDGGGERPVA